MKKTLPIALLLTGAVAVFMPTKTVHSQPAGCPTATTSRQGCVKPDGTSITIANGVISAPTGGSGTVTHVGMTMPAEFAVGGTPITTTGTFTVTKANQSANTFYAGPSSGSAAAPLFRILAPGDLPVATTSAFGAVKPDGTTITISSGVITAVGGGGITYPGAGVPNSTGTAWGTSYSVGTAANNLLSLPGGGFAGLAGPSGFLTADATGKYLDYNTANGPAIPTATIAAGGSQIPPASSAPSIMYIVTDGASTCDTSTGGGSTRVLLIKNGGSWTAPNCGAGSSLKGVIVYTASTWTPTTSVRTAYSPDTIDYDSSGGTMWSSGSPTVITAPAAGAYEAECVITGGSGSGAGAIEFVVAGSSTAGTYLSFNNSVSTLTVIEGIRVMHLNASDTVGCQYYLGNSSSTAGGISNSHFSLRQLGW